MAISRCSLAVSCQVSPGVVALTPGSILRFPIDTRVVVGNAADASALLWVGIEYLTSYEQATAPMHLRFIVCCVVLMTHEITTRSR